MKIVKAKSKARGRPKTKFQNFFTFLGSLGVFYCMISIFLSFEVIKAKKAAVVAGAAFLFLWKFMVSKLHLQHPGDLFKVLMIQKGADTSRQGILKAKMCHKGQKIEQQNKNIQHQIDTFSTYLQLLVQNFFLFFKFLAFVTHFGLQNHQP